MGMDTVLKGLAVLDVLFALLRLVFIRIQYESKIAVQTS